LATDPLLPPIELDADRFELSAQAIDQSGEFGRTYTDQDGEVHSYAALAPLALEQQTQLELELTGYTRREAIRRALADKLEREVLPIAGDKWLDGIPERLRTARQGGKLGLRLKDGKRVFCWDEKAGLARLCPDDAREEAMRLRRRVMPTAQKLRDEGHRFLYCVLTIPNSAAGELRKGMAEAFDRLKGLLAAKNKHGEKKFPQIRGALAVLEAPLGQSRDWNVHLNVILPVKGFLDFGELRQHWHWHLGGCKWIPDAPGAFEAAMAELIKYPVAAMVEKSAEHADQAKSLAPPMLDWRPGELVEWLRAMRGFRRTRAYGALYGAKAPEAEDMGPVVWIGRISFRGGRYVADLPLLRSIPEDKSGAADRFEAFRRSLAPGGICGAGHLGDRIPRDAVHTSINQLENVKSRRA
jgi:hypothetical protein